MKTDETKAPVKGVVKDSVLATPNYGDADASPPAAPQPINFPEIIPNDHELLSSKDCSILAFSSSGPLYKYSAGYVYKMNSSLQEFDFMKAAGDCCVTPLSRVTRVLRDTGSVIEMGFLSELATPFDLKAVPIEERANVKDEMIDLLTRLHERGIVHGDIKPENIVRCRDGKLRFCDFAEARWIKKRSKAIDQVAHQKDKDMAGGSNGHDDAVIDNSSKHDDTEDRDANDHRPNKKARLQEADTRCTDKKAGEAINTNTRGSNTRGLETRQRPRTRAMARAESKDAVKKDAGAIKTTTKGSETRQRPRTRAMARAEAKKAEARKAEAKDVVTTQPVSKQTHVNTTQDDSLGVPGVEVQDTKDISTENDDCESEVDNETSLTWRYASPSRALKCIKTDIIKPATTVDDWYALAISLWELYTGQSFLPGLNDHHVTDLLAQGATVDIMAVKDRGVREYIKKLLEPGSASICLPAVPQQSALGGMSDGHEGRFVKEGGALGIKAVKDEGAWQYIEGVLGAGDARAPRFE